MTRRTTTRPEVRVGGFWLSTIVPQGWGELVHKTRLNGSWEASWSIPANPLVKQWRHPALVYGALVEVMLGPIVVWSGTLEEPDWDDGRFIALGACRDGETAVALDGSGNSSTAPNTVIDAAITRGVLSWTRVGDFGTAAVGDATGGLVTVQSVLDAWAAANNSRWYVTPDRQLIIDPVDETTPDWYVMPGSGVLGSASDDRVDRVFARYIDSTTGQRATVTYPAATPAGGIEKPIDLTDRGAMTSADATTIATSTWSDLQGRSGWTNGLNLIRGQVTTAGGTLADLALIKAGDTVRLLGVPDPRGVAHNLDVVIGETDYEWTDDEAQVNPVGMAARDMEGVLESVGNLAVGAMIKASSVGGADDLTLAGDTVLAGSAPGAGKRKITRQASVIVTTNGSGNAAIAFSSPFPNGLLSVVAVAGAALGAVQVRDVGLSLAGFEVNTPVISSTHRINYVAVGW